MTMFFKTNDTPAAIRALQERLRFLSKHGSELPPIFIDGIYGTETEAAVRAFQKSKGLPVTGTVDLETHRILENEYRLLLRKNERLPSSPDFDSYSGGVISMGDRFDGVLTLQLLFRSIADQNELFNITADGVYGEETATAVRLFKALRGAEINENVDRLFWNELSVFASRYNEN